MTNGLCLRTSVRDTSARNVLLFLTRFPQLIGAIFRKSLRLSGRARMKHSVGQITTMISTDTARLDRNSWTLHKYVPLFVYSVYAY